MDTITGIGWLCVFAIAIYLFRKVWNRFRLKYGPCPRCGDWERGCAAINCPNSLASEDF